MGNMARAGRSALVAARKRGDMSRKTAGYCAGWWERFVPYIRAQGVRRMEHITTEHIESYAAFLRSAGRTAIAQENAVSAVNSVMRAVAGDRWRSMGNWRPVAEQERDDE